jgi:hypothetical protein
VAGPAAARVVDVADAVVAQIRAAWSPTAPDAVQRAWVANVCCNLDQPDQLIQGRQVYVIPVTHATPAWWDRQTKQNKYTVAVLVAERFTGEGWPDNAFLDPIVLWGEQTIFFPLSDPGLVLTGPAGVVTKANPSPQDMPEVPVLIDRDKLTELKLALIQYTLVYQDGTNFAGG